VPPCLIGIEVGMGTHYLARAICQLGHDASQEPSRPARRHGRSIPTSGLNRCSAANGWSGHEPT
jgi:hypothetical protein